MDFNFTSEQELFRNEVRSFIAENLPAQTTDVSDEGMYDQKKFDERHGDKKMEHDGLA